MTAVLSPLAVQRFVDNLGLPLVGGKLFTYKAGTTTKQATYTDSSGGTPNTNPVILNFRGEAQVWLDPTLLYKFVLARATDTDPPANPIWTVDNISVLPIGFNFDLTATDTGSVNAIAVSIPTLPSPVAFTRIVVKVANTNTGATTITVNGGTAKAVTLENLAALTGGELVANGFYQFVFDGAEWILQSPALQPPQLRTASEIAAGVTPVNFWSLPYNGPRTGFVPSAIASVNRLALQNLISTMTFASVAGTTGTGYPDETWTGPFIEIPDGIYSIDDAITLPSYTVIRAKKVILIQTNAAKDHFTCSDPYRIDIEGITFKGGKSAFNATGANKDTARMRFARCDFQTANTTNYALSINMQTNNLLIEDCLVTDSPLFLDTNGDFCEIRDCWVNGYLHSTGLKPNSTASVNNRSRYMRVCGGSWVPESSGAGSTSSRWFNNQGGILSIEDTQFGSEGSGGLPIVYEFGNTATGGSPFLSNSGTIIKNCQLACGNSGRTDRGVIVLQGSLPSIIDVRGGQFVAFGKIVNDVLMTAPTLASWISSNIAGSSYKFSCTIECIAQEPTSNIITETVPAALLPFARLRIGTRGVQPGYTYLGPLNSSVTSYLPDWTGILGQAQDLVCGQQRSPLASTYFDAVLVTKTINAGATAVASAVVILDVSTAHSNGGVMYAQQAQYRITLLQGGTNNILSAVQTISPNDLAQGGAALGNIILCRVNGASTTAVQIQLQLNTPLGGGGVLTWSARLVSSANGGGGVGQVFSIASA